MASIYKRGQKHWIKFYLPGSSEPCRQSLGAINAPTAKLIGRRFELELALRVPEILRVELPAPLREIVDGRAVTLPAQDSSPTAEAVVREYVAFIRVENEAHHCRNKITHLVKFFGTQTVDGFESQGGPKRKKTKRERATSPGVFKGRLFSEISAAEVQAMIDGLPTSFKTKRHYRNTFHALFEFALKRNHYTATNFRYPNPMSALPTYHEKNHEIIYLTQSQINQVLGILECAPSVRIAVAVMIYAGLRRAETLWLQKKDVSPDLKFLSVVNKTDDAKGSKSSLKTGTRPVPILPELKEILAPYLSTNKSPWICPSPQGQQWDGDNFGKRHRELLAEHSLSHTCLHYRHTFATQRAAEKWPLFQIAKAMGNSVAVCERYYAAYIDPTLA
jgi:integrase